MHLNVPAVALEELITAIYTVINSVKLYFGPIVGKPSNILPKWQNSARWVKIRSSINLFCLTKNI